MDPIVPFIRAYARALTWSGYTYRSLAGLLHPDGPAAELERDDEWLYKQYLTSRLGPVKSFQVLDYHTFLPDVILAKVDRAGMAHSLEVRVPFLDHELVEYMIRLDERLYYRPGRYKPILHELLKKELPEEILRKPKKGFGAPVKSVRNVDHIRNELKKSRLIQDGLVNPTHIDQRLAEKDLKHLWPVYVFEMWYRRWGNDSV